MSVTYKWELIDGSKHKHFANGTSNDEEILAEFFANQPSTNDIRMLRAMAAAKGSSNNLWAEIADKLEQMQGDDYETLYQIKIWGEY